MTDTLFWRHKLQTILSGPSYHTQGQSNSWLQALINLLRELARRLHLHIVLGQPPRSLGWIVLALSVLGLTLLLSRFGRNRRTKEAAAPSGSRRPLDAKGFFLLADRHIAAGEYHEAARCYFLAAVTHLQSVRELNVNPNKTNGEYARELLRHKSPVSAAFLTLARACDELLYHSPAGSGNALPPPLQSLADTARASASLILQRERAEP
ncbi:MAG: DUF4129 domain-containing protein [Bacilli bacterium]